MNADLKQRAETAVNLSTIAAARYSIHQLTGIDNPAIVEQVLAEKDNRRGDDPGDTNYEDSPLPDTPEVRALTSQITGIMHELDTRLVPSPFWSHILAPGESTMFHTHSVGSYPGIGLSWAYYACVPERSGNLVFICQINEDRIFHRVTPAVGRLVVFSASMPHMTERHAGEGVRVSISGNFFLPFETTLAVLAGKTTSKVREYAG